MKNDLLTAIVLKLEGEIAMAKANIRIYLNHPAGIGEHSDIAETVEKEIEKIAAADEKIDTIEKHFGHR
tara:strand:- start:93 stop:299 length:207 start_codon:yes stop_codon:yes gene_type:complete